MPTSIEIYVRDLPASDAEAWLSDRFGAADLVRTEPARTYEVEHEEDTVRVFVAENIEGGAYTSVWFNGPSLPWTSIRACAREAFEALNQEVICDHDGHQQDPWAMLRITNDGETRIDEREVSF
jgi:hypothetical protein